MMRVSLTALRRLAPGLVGAVVTAAIAQDTRTDYPPTRRVDQVDTLHGTKVEDPYRWLEADLRTSKEVADWVAAQNKVTATYLAGIPERAAVQRRLAELWNYERVSPPHRVAGRYYAFTRNDGLRDQDVVYTAETPDAEPMVLLDPNGWTKDGTTALAGIEFSPDGKHMAYGVSESGSDWLSWKVLDVGSRKPLADDLRWTKFTGVSWAADGTGFYYSRYPEPKPGEKHQAVPRHQKVYFHRLGTPQGDDVLVYERPDQPTWLLNARVTGDGRYLVVRLAEGGRSGNARYVYRDLCEPGSKFADLIGPADAIYRFIDSDGPAFYFQTDLDAPRGRVVAIDARQPARKDWKTVIPEGDATLQLVNRVGDRLVCNYFKDAHTQLKVFSLDGTFTRELPLPGIGTAGGIEGSRSDTEVHFAYLSFATPPSVYRHDLTTGKTTLWRQPRVKFDPDDYEVKQVFYKGKDGTKVPMFVSHRKRLKLDGKNPTLLHGYGGFNLSLAPDFDPAWLAWMEMGGVRAEPPDGVRRLHRRGRVPDRREVHPAGEAGDPREQQRRPAGGGVYGAAAGPVRGVPARRGDSGHAPVPQVRGRSLHRGGARVAGRPGRVQGAAGDFAVPQPEEGGEVPGDAGDDGGHGRPGGADAQLQVRRHAATLPGGGRPGAAAGRVRCRPRRRPDDVPAGRGGRRPVGVPGQEPRHTGSGTALTPPGGPSCVTSPAVGKARKTHALPEVRRGSRGTVSASGAELVPSWCRTWWKRWKR
jgi:prolyl oligopeptidase